ncbi:MAG: ABC transporter ATP-binding protein [Patescibacteria group bacterium]|nr:MAG: ABC transporter ATP-binding protein [Patescibacteria group bacterium]
MFDEGRTVALNGVSLGVERGEFLAVQGPSGSGKSTLLHLIGALDRPDRGTLVVDGVDLVKVRNLNRFRSEKIGFIFQLHNLIPHLTALENVLIPASGRKGDFESKARTLLEEVGLGSRLGHRPPQLSGGERQRVAIARALINDPKIVLADEPTGNVDSRAGQHIMKILRGLQSKKGVTLILVTHDRSLAEEAGRTINILDGRVV